MWLPCRRPRPALPAAQAFCAASASGRRDTVCPAGGGRPAQRTQHQPVLEWLAAGLAAVAVNMRYPFICRHGVHHEVYNIQCHVHLAFIDVACRLSACLAPGFYVSAGMYLMQGHKALRCYLNTPSTGALLLNCPFFGMYGSADGAAEPGPDQRVSGTRPGHYCRLHNAGIQYTHIIWIIMIPSLLIREAQALPKWLLLAAFCAEGFDE